MLSLIVPYVKRGLEGIANSVKERLSPSDELPDRNEAAARRLEQQGFLDNYRVENPSGKEMWQYLRDLGFTRKELKPIRASINAGLCQLRKVYYYALDAARPENMTPKGRLNSRTRREIAQGYLARTRVAESGSPILYVSREDGLLKPDPNPSSRLYGFSMEHQRPIRAVMAVAMGAAPGLALAADQLPIQFRQEVSERDNAHTSNTLLTLDSDYADLGVLHEWGDDELTRVGLSVPLKLSDIATLYANLFGLRETHDDAENVGALKFQPELRIKTGLGLLRSGVTIGKKEDDYLRVLYTTICFKEGHTLGLSVSDYDREGFDREKKVNIAGAVDLAAYTDTFLKNLVIGGGTLGLAGKKMWVGGRYKGELIGARGVAWVDTEQSDILSETSYDIIVAVMPGPFGKPGFSGHVSGSNRIIDTNTVMHVSDYDGRRSIVDYYELSASTSRTPLIPERGGLVVPLRGKVSKKPQLGAYVHPFKDYWVGKEHDFETRKDIVAASVNLGHIVEKTTGFRLPLDARLRVIHITQPKDDNNDRTKETRVYLELGKPF